MQQTAVQPYRPLPPAGVQAAEPKRPRAGRDCQRLDRVAQRRAGGLHPPELGIQRVGPPRAAAAQQLRAPPGGPQPATDHARRATEAPGDHAVPGAPGSLTQRFADHLRAIAPARNAPRRAEHVRGPAAATARPSRPHRAHARQHPHPRERAKPRGDSRPPQPGQDSAPEANSASRCCSLTATINTADRLLTHAP
jgi:hypothetical protein